MLQQPKGDDFVLVTGRMTTVRAFIEMAAHAAGFDLVRTCAGIDEIGTDRRTNQPIIRINPTYYRPAEVD